MNLRYWLQDRTESENPIGFWYTGVGRLIKFVLSEFWAIFISLVAAGLDRLIFRADWWQLRHCSPCYFCYKGGTTMSDATLDFLIILVAMAIILLSGLALVLEARYNRKHAGKQN